jgi:DNA (cytosine-5)-methyltransferase 1
MTDKLLGLSLFSGAGGMDIGVREAGFKVLAQVEIDPHCCETLRAAEARDKLGTMVIEKDIRTIDPEAFRRDLRLKKGELSVLFGGPPCQAFSQIGKRNSLDDARGMLLFEIVRFARAFQPKAIMIEQVKGVLNAPGHNGEKGAFQLLLDELESLNYVPKWRVMKAADYGVAQLRERVFIVATKKPNGFQFPDPTHSVGKETTHTLFPLPSYKTVGEVIKGLGKPPKLNGEIPENSHADVTPNGDRSRIHGVGEGSHLARELHLPEIQRGKLTKKDTTKYRRLDRGEPSLTLRCGEIFFHPTEDRYLTPREYMRIHGYPDTYFLKGPIRSRSGRVRHLDQHRQVANSVPPPLAQAIAIQIRRVIECLPSLKPSAIRSSTKAKKRMTTEGAHSVHS